MNTRKSEVIREAMMDVDDIAAALGLKPGSVRNAIVSHPTFPSVAKVSGNTRLWWSSEVQAWIAAHRTSVR